MSWNGPYESRFLRVDPEKGRFQVNRAAFSDPAVFELEKKLIFDRTWMVIGHESEVKEPGDFLRRDVGGRHLLFVKDRKGEIRAFLNTCAHRGSQVCQEASGNRKTFTCPYHGWVYRNSGELLTQNARQGYPEEFNDGRYNLQSVPRLEQRAGFYFINFDPNAMSLDDYLQDAGERLDRLAMHSGKGLEVVSGCHEYTIKANYKLMCENSYDGYHLYATHATYVDYMDALYEKHGSLPEADWEGQSASFGNGHACFEMRTPQGRPVAQWSPDWGPEAKVAIEAKRKEMIERLGEDVAKSIASTNRNMIIFPNSVINDQQTILLRNLSPISHNEMLVRSWALAPIDEDPVLRKVRLDGALSFVGPGGLATPDDVEMLELCQLGFENRDAKWNDISKGFHAGENTLLATDPNYDNELQMRAYWVQWDIMMTGGRQAAALAAE
jgi:p-cumate 2,3-dioxygenase alpha subunit